METTPVKPGAMFILYGTGIAVQMVRPYYPEYPKGTWWAKPFNSIRALRVRIVERDGLQVAVKAFSE